MTKKQKDRAQRLSMVVVILILSHFIENETARIALSLSGYLIAGYDIIVRAAKNILNRNFLDEYFLMTVATIGAIALGEYFEATEVMLLFQVGEWFQDYAVDISRRSLEELVESAPEYANIERDGQLVRVEPDAVEIGDVIVAKIGEKIPIDGVVVAGESSVNTANLTGESAPRRVSVGDDILSGTINLTGLLKIRTMKAFDESAIMKILELIEDTSEKKSTMERFITRFARIYTPIVVASALMLAIIPPLAFAASFFEWLRRALIFLVVSCPCALLVSVPLGFFGMIGSMSKKGVLVKGSVVIERLAKAKGIVFDKTGTLTRGTFQVVAIHAEKYDEHELLEFAAHIESFSNHPIARPILEAYQGALDTHAVEDFQEFAGKGLSGKVFGKSVLIGNDKLMADHHIAYKDCHLTGTIVHIAIEDAYMGHIIIADEIKEDSPATISSLKSLGFDDVIMLTGDSEKVGENISNELGLTVFYAELMPEDKVRIYEKIRAQSNAPIVYAGDGLNDAPVIAGADIGIAMGISGSQAAIDYADMILMDDQPSKIALAIQNARKTMRIVNQNVCFSIGIKVFVLALSALGFANMQYAIFADVGVMILAVLNSLRTIKM
ncbi:MAG: heavy metal translocating P-type ATPase [Bacillota bacterium]|nr:heavy metal translocating P-type ATPase [Bacillota bacterium]